MVGIANNFKMSRLSQLRQLLLEYNWFAIKLILVQIFLYRSTIGMIFEDPGIKHAICLITIIAFCENSTQKLIKIESQHYTTPYIDHTLQMK